MTLDEPDWESLEDIEQLKDARNKAEKKWGGLTSDQAEHLRKLAKRDLFFLCSGPLEYDRLSTGLHGHYCRWLEETRKEKFRLSLLPRGHYKSTIKTIGESVQIALPNDAGLDVHPWNLGPNVKLLIAHENRESASRFLYEIAAAFMRKPLMMLLFPECIPNPKEQRVNKWELELPRSVSHKEPTFDTMGVGGAAQGRHYDRAKMDDIVGEEARDSENVMKKTALWFDNVNSLLTRLKFDGWDLTGTRWSALDTYNHAMDRYKIKADSSFIRCMNQSDLDKMLGGVLAVYARGAIENGVPLFPEEFDMESLSILRRSPVVWSAQYANNPRDSGLTEFNSSWLNYYNVAANGDLIAFTGESRIRRKLNELDICVLIDPSMGESINADESGFIVTGTDSDGHVFLLETVKRRMKPPEVIQEMFRLYLKWHPRIISFEEVAFSAVFRYWFEEKCNELRIYPSVVPYKPGSKKTKLGRIRGLTNYFASGQVFAAEGMHEFRDEFEWFPLGNSEHLLDALAQGPTVWMGRSSFTHRRHLEEAKEAVMAERSALTGY